MPKGKYNRQFSAPIIDGVRDNRPASRDCLGCGKHQPSSEFNTLKKRHKGYTILNLNSRCRRCRSLESKEKYVPVEEQELLDVSGFKCSIVWANQIKCRYGITVEEYVQIRHDQDHKCLICETSFEDVSAHLDHCHSTGEIRGVLCRYCNLGLGNFKDNTDILRKAIEYLDNSNK